MQLRFFDAWRSGAYANAVDHLHRYFDYAMEGYVVHQDVKTYHQYALLHLAVLHADFGCYDEAIAAMNECIATGWSFHEPQKESLLTAHSPRESRRTLLELWAFLASPFAQSPP